MTERKPVRTLIVDDELPARRGMRALLERDDEIRIVGESSDGISAISAIQDLRPDLVFLDIQMPELNGFEVLRALGPDAPRCVVFVTAYDRYALRAFDVAAVDYLLKPFEDERFELTMTRVKHALRTSDLASLEQRVQALLERVDPAAVQGQSSHGNDAEPLKRIIVRENGRVHVIRTEEIDWIEAADYYSRLHVGARTHLLRETMASLESKLDARLFYRVHRSAIVNLDRVVQILPHCRGEHVALLRDGTRLRLSRGRREVLQQRLTNPPKRS